MSKEMTIIALGALVAVAPFLGIPGSWKSFIYVGAGICIAGAGFLLRGEALARGESHSGDHHFVENSATPPPRHDQRIGSLN